MPRVVILEGLTGDQVSIEQLNAPVEVNELIRDFLAQTVAPADESVWEFVCECGQPGCREHVALTLELYDESRYTGEPVVARGHLRARARAARRWSAELREEAQAVRNQSRHQVRRLDRIRRAGNYTIVVRGKLGDPVDRRFDGMMVTCEEGKTIIVGSLRDQAELQGVLQRVTDLGLTLLSVTSDS